MKNASRRPRREGVCRCPSCAFISSPARDCSLLSGSVDRYDFGCVIWLSGSSSGVKNPLTTEYPLPTVTHMTGEELRRIRKKLGLTQHEFADLVGLHVNSLARQERSEIGMREWLAPLIQMLAK
jgi:DNA-binding transcriptional regulator YiaG